MQRLGGSLRRRSGRKPSPLQKCKNPGWRLWRLPEAVALEAGPISGADSKLSSNRQHRRLRLFHSSTWGFAWICLWQRRREGAGLGQPLIGVGLALSMACGAVAMLGPPPNWRFAVEQAIKLLPRAVSAFKVPETIALQTARGEQPSSMDGHDSVLPMAVTPSGASRSQELGIRLRRGSALQQGRRRGPWRARQGRTRR